MTGAWQLHWAGDGGTGEPGKAAGKVSAEGLSLAPAARKEKGKENSRNKRLLLLLLCEGWRGHGVELSAS